MMRKYRIQIWFLILTGLILGLAFMYASQAQAQCTDTLWYLIRPVLDTATFPQTVIPESVLVVLVYQAGTRDSVFLEYPFIDSLPYCADSIDLAYWFFKWGSNWTAGIPGPVPGKANPVDLSADSVFVKGGWVDTVDYVKAGNVSPLGDGTDTLNLVAYDSAAGAPVEGVVVTVKNAAGLTVHVSTTNGSGVTLATLVDGAQYSIMGYGMNVTWNLKSYTMSAGDTDTLWGYSIDPPAAAAAPQWVTAYADFGTAYLDTGSGAVVAAQELEVTLEFIAEEKVTCSSYVIIPESQTKRPSSSGRVYFYIMANSECTPAGSHYELRYSSRRGRPQAGGIIKKFVVDTTPDPLNIINADEWYQ